MIAVAAIAAIEIPTIQKDVPAGSVEIARIDATNPASSARRQLSAEIEKRAGLEAVTEVGFIVEHIPRWGDIVPKR